MLGLLLRMEAQPRLKKGSAAHSTTGVASANSTQIAAGSLSHERRNGRPIIGPMVMSSNGTDSAALTQKRREKSTSSGFGPSSPVGTPIGSSAMPQIGQSPGLSRTISGCIGQVYCVPIGIGAGSGRSPRYFSGSASNFFRQFSEQK